MGLETPAMALKSAEEAASTLSLPLITHYFEGLQDPHVWAHCPAQGLTNETF